MEDGRPRMSQGQREALVVTELKAAIRAAEAILLVTPEHNYPVPGVADECDRQDFTSLRRQRVEWESGGDHGRPGQFGTVRVLAHFQQESGRSSPHIGLTRCLRMLPAKLSSRP